DFGAAEDAVQEALLAAATQWPRDGAPQEPVAWLTRVAWRRLADHVRADAARRRREAHVVSLVPADEQVALAPDEGGGEGDDTLALLFMCCHPALTSASAIALTLRAMGGLSTAEIARAFFVPEATMAQRISRAKARIKAEGARFEVPDEAALAARLPAVMHVLYLIFSEGYAASSGDAVLRLDLSQEALRLARMLHRAAPQVAEVAGLLALMRLTDARRAARIGPAGALVPLDQQDRSRWDREAIAEGVAFVSEALPRGPVGPYLVQAAIAALHDEAPSTEATDWPQIAALYEVLMGLADNPMVALSHAVAVAMVDGPAAGLARVEAVAADPRVTGHHRVEAVRGHLLERAGRVAEAVACYRRAAARTTSEAERRYLLTHAARLAE
ncbi:MAG: RNA polymerase sigma factor, partial [Deltaproteobacteria bacterium]|nr:RNA polymerase sigma factor [Deltaproteobacteria bacterium]